MIQGIDQERARAIYDKMQVEGSFWDYVAYGGLDFLDGTEFENMKSLLLEAHHFAVDFEEEIEQIADFPPDEED